MSFNKFSAKWRKELNQYLPQYANQITKFLMDEELGLKHSHDVWKLSLKLSTKIEDFDKKHLDKIAVEYIAIFHDIGKFFQKFHSLENISISQNVFKKYALNKNLPSKIKVIVLDGIKNSDFYNKRLDPSLKSPTTIEGKTVRSADKMLDNFVKKVDRYWYDYGVPRKVKFFDPKITLKERTKFSFENFSGDQLNVILSIISLQPKDFFHPILQKEYQKWSHKPKQKAISRIISLAEEIGESPKHVEMIKKIINWYRQKYNC